jgi:hypothetical protein
LSYDRDVRVTRITRAVLAVLCIALIVLFSALAPSAAHLDLSTPALVVCFLLAFSLSLLHTSDDSAAPQPISFLAVQTSRAPPLA